MTIHSLFTELEQDVIHIALNNYYDKCKRNAESPIRGHGKSTEFEKKEQWRLKALEIHELVNKIVDLSI